VLPSLIGVIHLSPLAGSPRSDGVSPAECLQRAGLQAAREAELLTRAGFEGIILENFGDAPFYKDKVPAETIASIAVIAAAVREVTRLPIGINVLRNDAMAALAIAASTGCQFIRVNVLSGVAATDQGLIEGHAAELFRERDRLGVRQIAVFADAHVKHARSLSSEDIALSVEDLALRAMADAVIITGSTTGRPVDFTELEKSSEAARAAGIPLYLGSGATAANVRELRPWVHGVIVGSAIRKGGKAGQPLDLARVRKFVKAYRLAKPSSKKKKTSPRQKKKKVSKRK
jgi:membrane complex biogenesis BtpA family protein